MRLDELPAANQTLFAVYVLKDDLKRLWRYRHLGYARRFLEGWYQRAMTTSIDPLRTFAHNLCSYFDGITSHCRWPLSTALLEGIKYKAQGEWPTASETTPTSS